MWRRHNPNEFNLGDWTEWLAKFITAIVLGLVIGVLFGWQVEEVGILWGCVIWILVFTAIGFREQIRYFIHLLVRLTAGR